MTMSLQTPSNLLLIETYIVTYAWSNKMIYHTCSSTLLVVLCLQKICKFETVAVKKNRAVKF